MGKHERAIVGRAGLLAPRAQVAADRRDQVDRAAAPARALAVLQAVQLPVGVGQFDEQRHVAHGVPVQRQRLLRPKPGVGHEPHEHGAHPVAAPLEVGHELLDLQRRQRPGDP